MFVWRLDRCFLLLESNEIAQLGQRFDENGNTPKIDTRTTLLLAIVVLRFTGPCGSEPTVGEEYLEHGFAYLLTFSKRIRPYVLTASPR